jgi:protein-disulfide isomerase
MHAAILEGQRHLTALFLTEAAQGLDLDMEAFQACRKHPKTAQRIQADIAEGDRAGIRGTPALFFNGRRYDLTFGGGPDDLARTVDRLLAGLPTHGSNKASGR